MFERLMILKSIRIFFWLFLLLNSASLLATINYSQKVYFSKNDPKVRPQYFPLLKDVVEIVKANRNKIPILTIMGHTDSVGGDGENLRISLLQAEEVKKELGRLGIPTHMLRVEAYGAALPRDSNESELGRANNRRVEFRAFAEETCWGQSSELLQNPVFTSLAIASEEIFLKETEQAGSLALSQREFALNCLIQLNLQIKDYQKVRLYFHEMLQWNRHHPNDKPYLFWSNNIDPLTELVVPYESWERVPSFIASTTNRYPENSFERAEYFLKLADIYLQQGLSHPTLWLSLGAVGIVKNQFESPHLISQRLSHRRHGDLKRVEKELNVIVKTILYLIHEGYEEWARDLVERQNNFIHKLRLPSDKEKIKQKEQVAAWFLEAEFEAAYGSAKKSKKLYQKALKRLDKQTKLDHFEKDLKEKIQQGLDKIS